jgi:hypothetical protein
MKNFVVVVCVAAATLFAASASAGPINYGTADELQGGYNYKTGECTGLTLSQCEELSLAEALGVSVDDVSLTKINTTSSDWVSVDDGNAATNMVAFDFSKYGITDPAAYVVKFGNTVYDFYVYTNSALGLKYAYIDLNDDGLEARSGNITITSISHVATVPEAGSLSLLLSGLGALGLVSVKRFRFSR